MSSRQLSKITVTVDICTCNRNCSQGLLSKKSKLCCKVSFFTNLQFIVVIKRNNKQMFYKLSVHHCMSTLSSFWNLPLSCSVMEEKCIKQNWFVYDVSFTTCQFMLTCLNECKGEIFRCLLKDSAVLSFYIEMVSQID